MTATNRINPLISIHYLDFIDHHKNLIDEIEFAFSVQQFRKLSDGGLQITDNMFDLHLKELTIFKSLILEKINQTYPDITIKDIRCFANKNFDITVDNDYHEHLSYGYGIGGVYYVCLPGEGGELEFRNPGRIIRPERDLLLLFCGTYEHRVKKYIGQPRYGIGIDVTI